MAEQLVADRLIEQARKATGIADFDSDSYREGLDVLVRDVNRQIGNYTASGLGRVVGDIGHYLRNRLKVSDYLRQNPELLTRPVERPVEPTSAMRSPGVTTAPAVTSSFEAWAYTS